MRKRLNHYYSSSYLLRTKTTSAISNALLKYGYSNFSLEIQEYCDSLRTIKREQHYMDLLKPEYNILSKAGSSLGHKHNEETNAKMRGKNHPMFGRTGKNHPMFGYKHSDITRAAISARLLGSLKSEETKAKLAASMVGNSNSRNHP
jgi:group I intron endonuclease